MVSDADRRPSGRSSSSSRPSAPTTASSARRAPGRRPRAAGAGSSTRSTGRRTSSTASPRGRSALPSRTRTAGLGVVHAPPRARSSRPTAARATFLERRADPVQSATRARSSARSSPRASAMSPTAVRPGRVIRQVLPRSATSAAPARRRSTWPGWPRGASTPTWSAASSAGTGPPGACWSRRPGAATHWLEDDLPGLVAASSAELLAELRAFLQPSTLTALPKPGPKRVLERHVEQPERLEVARPAGRPGVDRAQTAVGRQLDHRRLGLVVAPGDEHVERLAGDLSRLQRPRERRVERLDEVPVPGASWPSSWVAEPSGGRDQRGRRSPLTGLVMSTMAVPASRSALDSTNAWASE